MFPVLGQITRRLLDQFGPDDPGWNPPRGTAKPVTAKPAETVRFPSGRKKSR